ncbi:MBL fold metallo-hydrolase [Butyrivibrio fibrisolvens]|uniref:MBL fold metallo-hydrolase n=1 Tax=Butyrivibrio fibrisolvens TaxID=831 RepID=UPI0003B326E6|nr:MBL fold metallo-hydrolase [Butyrivibrio fibrisolvens]
MSDENKIRVIPRRGAMQIGGVCTEIATDNMRIMFDFGSPLEGEGRQDVLDIEGVTTGKANCDAVFITHYHGDHVGEVPNIMADIPVYMHKTAREILQAQQEHKVSVGQIVWAKEIKELTEGVPIVIKDLKITPLASDHSASDSLMYLVEGCGKRILITGDYRLHGFYADRLKGTLKNLGHIDLLITEGTNLSRSSSNYKDEQWCEKEFWRILRENKYVFLLASSSNIDRIAAFSRCVPRGEYALTDGYQTHVMRIADKNRDEEFKSFKIHPYREEKRGLYEKGGFGMIIRAGKRHTPLVKEFFEKYPDKTCLVYSMWKGYETLPDVAELLEYSKGHIERVHVSGHITKEDLEQVISIIKPEKLMIHHTDVKDVGEQRLKIPISTELLNIEDGESFIV